MRSITRNFLSDVFVFAIYLFLFGGGGIARGKYYKKDGN